MKSDILVNSEGQGLFYAMADTCEQIMETSKQKEDSEGEFQPAKRKGKKRKIKENAEASNMEIDQPKRPTLPPISGKKLVVKPLFTILSLGP